VVRGVGDWRCVVVAQEEILKCRKMPKIGQKEIQVM